MDAGTLDGWLRDASRPDALDARPSLDHLVQRDAREDAGDAASTDAREAEGSPDAPADGPGFCATALSGAPGGAYVVCDDFDETAGSLVAGGSSPAQVQSVVRDSPPNAEVAVVSVDAGSASSFYEVEVASGQSYSVQMDFQLGPFDADPSSLAVLVEVVFGSAPNASRVGVQLVPSAGGGASALEVYESEPMGTGSTTVAHAPTAVQLTATWSRLLVQIYAAGGVWKDLVTLNPTSAAPVVIESGILTAAFANTGQPTVEIGLPATTGSGVRHVYVDNVLIESNAD
jgi:hypothetical protein